jgi:hypothetical protein
MNITIPLSSIQPSYYSHSLTNGSGCSCSTSQTDGAGSTDGEVQQSHGPHWTHTHRGMVSDCPELEPAQKLDPLLSPEVRSTNNCPDSTNVDGRTESLVEKKPSPRELTFPRVNPGGFLSMFDPMANLSHGIYSLDRVMRYSTVS